MTQQSEVNENGSAKQYALRFLRLFLGIFLYALGVVVTVRANIGYAPWEVFHAGISRTTGISLGAASISVGVAIVAFVYFLGEKFGAGTLLNMLFVGLFIDLIMLTGIIPLAGGPELAGVAAGAVMLTVGLFIIALGSYFYIGAGFGAGPRDSLMVALKRRTGLPIGLCRSFVELSALTAGWLLGGMVGVGTIFSMLAIGAIIQLVFRLLNFRPENIKHETLTDTYNALRPKR